MTRSDGHEQLFAAWRERLGAQRAGLPRIRSLTDVLEPTLNRLAQAAPAAFAAIAPVAAGARRLYPVVQAFDETQPRVLLHGDFGWRNLLVRDDHTLVLLDFERAFIGPAWLDLAKCVDAGG